MKFNLTVAIMYTVFYVCSMFWIFSDTTLSVSDKSGVVTIYVVSTGMVVMIANLAKNFKDL